MASGGAALLLTHFLCTVVLPTRLGFEVYFLTPTSKQHLMPWSLSLLDNETLFKCGQVFWMIWYLFFTVSLVFRSYFVSQTCVIMREIRIDIQLNQAQKWFTDKLCNAYSSVNLYNLRIFTTARLIKIENFSKQNIFGLWPKDHMFQFIRDPRFWFWITFTYLKLSAVMFVYKSEWIPIKKCVEP